MCRGTGIDLKLGWGQYYCLKGIISIKKVSFPIALFRKNDLRLGHVSHVVRGLRCIHELWDIEKIPPPAGIKTTPLPLCSSALTTELQSR